MMLKNVSNLVWPFEGFQEDIDAFTGILLKLEEVSFLECCISHICLQNSSTFKQIFSSSKLRTVSPEALLHLLLLELSDPDKSLHIFEG